MCSATGFSTMHSSDGDTIGPRADNEYAGEPVGVATITPSPENGVTYSRSMYTASRSSRCRARFSTMTSFSAHGGSVHSQPSDVATTAKFFFQAEDGIRDGHVTGVQTCALPI